MSALKDQTSEFQLTPLSEDQIKELQIPDTDLWYLMIEEIPQGPYHAKDLKEFLEMSSEFDHKILACTQGNDQWRPLYEHPLFARRKPEVLNEDVKKINNNLYLLINGQPVGPLKTDDIQHKLDNKEILFTDQLSFDEGSTWVNIYDHPNFDRRYRKSSDLPYRPVEEVFDQSKQEAEQQLHHKYHSDEARSEDQLIKLAQKSQGIEHEDNDTEMSKKTPMVKSNSSSLIIIAIVILGLLAFYYLEPGENKGADQKASPKLEIKKIGPSNKLPTQENSKKIIDRRGNVRTDAGSSNIKPLPKNKVKAKKTTPGKTKPKTTGMKKLEEIEKELQQEEDYIEDLIEDEYLDEEEELAVDDEGLIGEKTEFNDEIGQNEEEVEGELDF